MKLRTSIPFWSWNDKLETEKLKEQMNWFEKNGFGGFIMHARGGLKTEYLGEEWFNCIKYCCEYAKETGLQAWAYDENGWPSGFGGGKLSETKEYREHYLKTSVGLYDETAFLHYDLDKDELCLTEDTNAQNCLNLYDVESVSQPDILDDTVTEQFIQHTHERYKAELGETFQELQGFFTDEPQYSRKGAPVPHKIRAYFLQEYGEDPIPSLGFLFVEKKGYRKFRYRYWKACQKLLLENFAKKVYSWCEENNVKLIGHYVEERDNYSQMLFNAGIMPFYEFMHYPGIDWLGRRYMNLCAIKQMSSVAAQLEKKYTLSETFAMTGWDVTPKELKNIADYQYLFGVNLMCHHLVPYSEAGERKRDYPTHFTPFNPWVNKAIGRFNAHFDKLGEWLRAGKEEVHIGVLHTIRSAYFDYRPKDPTSTRGLDISLGKTGNLLAQNRLAFHFIDETLLAKYGSVQGAKLKIGACSYDVLILPRIYTMDKTTEKLLREFVSNAGKVCLLEDKPTWLEDEPFDYDYLHSNITIEELALQNDYKVQCDTEVFTALYTVGDKKYVFAVNKTGKEAQIQIVIDNETCNAKYDVETGECVYVGENITIKAFSSGIYTIENCKVSEQEKYETVTIGDGNYQVQEFSENYLTLDYAQVSFDGNVYGERLPIVGIFQMLMQKRYRGEVYLKFDFNLKYISNDLKVMLENPESLELFVNGNKVSDFEPLATESNFKRANIVQWVRFGQNEIIAKYHFFQREDVYFALFGKETNENLVNSLVYDTNIENFYLCGHFGVYAEDFKKGTKENVWTAEKFYIGNPPERLTNVLLDGFPFFAGALKLKRNFNCNGKKTKLCFNGRFHFAQVYVNGCLVGDLIFDNELDVSGYVQNGENDLEIVFYTGNRNLLGPHHAVEEEVLILSPNNFEMRGTWKEGKSHCYLDRYTFVRFGCFDKKKSEEK